MDLYIIPDTEDSPYRRRIFFPKSEGPVFLWQDLVKMLAVVALSTLVAYGFLWQDCGMPILLPCIFWGF